MRGKSSQVLGERKEKISPWGDETEGGCIHKHECVTFLIPTEQTAKRDETSIRTRKVDHTNPQHIGC